MKISLTIARIRFPVLVFIVFLSSMVTPQTSAFASTTVTFGDNTVDDFTGTVEDTIMWELSTRQNRNYGITERLGVGEVDPLSRRRRMLIRFRDLADNIGPDKQIVSATLYLYCVSELSATNYSVSGYRALLDWVEGSSDNVEELDASCWNAAQLTSVPWNAPGCDAASDILGEDSTADRRATAESSTVITGPGQYFSWDVTTAVSHWYDESWSEYGLVLINNAEGTLNSRKTFFSSQLSNPDGQRPYLSVTYDDVSSETHYVWSGGSNTSPYTSWTTAAHAIQDAIDVASVGATVMVRSGAYDENITIKDGVDVINNPGETPVMVGDGINPVVTYSGAYPNGCSLDGFDISNGGINGGIYLVGSNTGITNTTVVQNCFVHGNLGPGINVRGVSALTAPEIRGNDIYGNTEEGIYVIDAGSLSVDLIIENNNIYNHLSAGGVNIGGESYVTIGPDNDIYNNFAGIAFFTGNALTETVTIFGNTIFGNDQGGISVRDATTGLLTIESNDIRQNIRGGIGIQNACNLVIDSNQIRDNTRGGIHTGTDLADGGGFLGSIGSAVLTIRRNKVHNNGGSGYGGGIDVRHAAGIIENNLVYENDTGGIRFGDYITEILNNTVTENGLSGSGGGIIYDDLAGLVNDLPNGNLIFPNYPLIRNNISTHNQKAGLRVGYMPTGTPPCPENLDYVGDGLKYSDFNLLYLNNETTYDCKWGETFPDRRCVNRNYGGCGLDENWQMIYPNDIISDPLFKNIAIDDYRLQMVSDGDPEDSPALGAGEGGSDMGAYGGSYPIDW